MPRLISQWSRWLLWALCAVCGWLSTPEARAACSCSSGPFNSSDESKGIFWTGDRRPPFRELVELLAPVLWYTADEPAIIQEDLPIPHAHPCDPVRKNGVVYYQLNWVGLRGGKTLSAPYEEDPEFTEKADHFGVRFYFFHKFDYGLNGHLHDLEMAEFRVALERTRDGCHQARLTHVIGFAHGTDWYSNELLVEADTKLPITLLIEEGKHASGPDRNSDGQFTPGYDINTRVNDAWGVRDVFGSGYLLGGSFKSSMAKPRDRAFRVLPPPSSESSCQPPALRSIEKEPKFLNRYELRPGYEIPLCEGIENREHLAKWTKKNDFGSEYRAPQQAFEFATLVREPLTSSRGWFPKVSVRYDRNLGIALAFNAFDLKELYAVPKLNLVNNNSSLELLFTKTATQYASPYLSLGYGSSQPTETAPVESSLVAEAGLKFRLRVDWPWRILGAGYEFTGVRFGLRTSGFNNLGNVRYIAEFGAGLW